MSSVNTVVNYPGVAEVAGMVMSPTGGQVLYVGSTTTLANLGQVGQSIAARFYTSVNSALAACVSGRGDWIYVLPGYTESITADAWSNLAATDVTVCGLGHNTNRPAFTWTVAGSTMLFDIANFRLLNCQLFLAGADAAGSALTVGAPITISAAGCEISDCNGRFGFDADQIVTVGITTSAGADDLILRRNKFYGATAAECTTFMDLIGTDRLIMENNVFAGATSSTGVGIVRFATTASLNIELNHNTYINRKAASAAAVTGLAGVSGVSRNEMFHYLDNSSTTPWVTSPGIMCFYNPRTTNLAGEVGMISTVVST